MDDGAMFPHVGILTLSVSSRLTLYYPFLAMAFVLKKRLFDEETPLNLLKLIIRDVQ